ncbi:MAG: hypothetical protein IPM23_24795 [Candidatus Melainabacteria bacterium]|nr:hypothetical protein [Candidatus Melainabacteria bacterium]
MGFEFKISLANRDGDRIEQVLCSAPFYSDYDASREFFNFREPEEKRTGWPALWAKLDPDGIYLCHNGNRAVFKAVVDHIRQNLGEGFGEFRMDEL